MRSFAAFPLRRAAVEKGKRRMTTKERDKLASKMLWIIPAMLLCILGDYCMGIASSGGRLGAQQEYMTGLGVSAMKGSYRLSEGKEEFVKA